MAREKQQRLLSFSTHLEEAMERSLKEPTGENMQRLKELFELQSHLKNMNEGPFDVNTIWQLITALLIPIALAMLEIDADGLDEMDNRLLELILTRFNGGPVGIRNLAVSIGEDVGTLDEVYEPFLIQEGFIMRTPRGREVTAKAYQHLGKKPFDKNTPSLF